MQTNRKSSLLIQKTPQRASSQILKLYVFLRREVAYIKWLQAIRRIRQYIKCNDLIFYIVLVNLRRSVAIMAVQDKQAVDSLYTSLYIAVKVLNLLIYQLVYYLAIITNSECLVRRQRLVLAYLEELYCQDNKGQDSLPSRVDPFDYCYLLIITQLNSNCAAYYIRASNNF